MEDPTMAPPVNSQNPLVPPVQGDENSPERKLEEYCGFPVLEEMALVFVEEEAPENVGWITEVTQTEDVVPAMIPQQSFSVEQLQLIFDLRRDVADQLHCQEILNCRLDMFFDSLSSEPEKRRCPTCCHPFTFLQFCLTLRQLMVIKVLLVFDILMFIFILLHIRRAQSRPLASFFIRSFGLS
jgi:hypothetical protein